MDSETKSIARMSKAELRKTLMALGYTEGQLNDDQGKSLKRPDLCEKLQAHKQGDEGLNALANISEPPNDDDDDVGIAVEPDTKVGEILGVKQCRDGMVAGKHYASIEDVPDNIDSEIDQNLASSDIPTPNDPGWTQYVLGKFLEDEMDGENPRVEGLRRVAGLLVGELIEEGCDLIAAPTEDNRFRACAKAWAVFLISDGSTKRFEALADAHGDNCHENYATYLVAMADTRAKGRVYRNALLLRRVVAAEEVSKTMAATADIQAGGSIHSGQIALIRIMADRHKFDIAKILDKIGIIEYKLNDKTGEVILAGLTYEETLAATKCMREMTESQKEKE